MKETILIYKKAGFEVTTALMDGEFSHICGDMADLKHITEHYIKGQACGRH